MSQSLTEGSYHRDVKVIQMPRSNDKNLLRNMSPECASITDLEISLYGNIPSLLRIVKQQREVQPNEKLKNILNKNIGFLSVVQSSASNKNEILRAFLEEGLN